MPTASKRRRPRTRARSTPGECDCKEPGCKEAPIVVLLGLVHPDETKRLDPRIVDITIVAESICIIVGK